jgi:hypothetical protein
MPLFDEDLTPEQWRVSEDRDDAEQQARDEAADRFREDCEFCEQFDAEPYPLLNALHHALHDADRGSK